MAKTEARNKSYRAWGVRYFVFSISLVGQVAVAHCLLEEPSAKIRTGTDVTNPGEPAAAVGLVHVRQNKYIDYTHSSSQNSRASSRFKTAGTIHTAYLLIVTLSLAPHLCRSSYQSSLIDHINIMNYHLSKIQPFPPARSPPLHHEEAQSSMYIMPSSSSPPSPQTC